MTISDRSQHEIDHGRLLAEEDTERIWGWKTPAGQLRAKRRAELIALGAGLCPNVHALEIGCGTGMFTEMFARTGARITAIDISPRLLEKAAARNLPRENVRFLEKRFEDCDVDGPFDAVIGSSVLHHLEIGQALPKILELLKNGGVFSFAEPNMLNPQVYIERKFRRFFPYVSPDETAFVRWSFQKSLQQTGFRDIDITPFDWLHPSVPESLIPVVSMMGRLLEKAPLIRDFSGSLYIKAVKPLQSVMQ